MLRTVDAHRPVASERLREQMRRIGGPAAQVHRLPVAAGSGALQELPGARGENLRQQTETVRRQIGVAENVAHRASRPSSGMPEPESAAATKRRTRSWSFRPGAASTWLET